MEEQFVTYEIALKLKELGFDEPCFGFFDKELFLFCLVDQESDCEINTITYKNGLNNIIADVNYETIIIAPLWQQVWSFLDDNGVIIGIIFVDNIFKYTLNIENYASNEFKDRMSVIKSATEYATNYLWNKKFNK